MDKKIKKIEQRVGEIESYIFTSFNFFVEKKLKDMSEKSIKEVTKYMEDIGKLGYKAKYIDVIIVGRLGQALTGEFINKK